MELSRAPGELGRGLFLFRRKKAMSILEVISADQQAVADAQAALDAANAKLADDEAKLAAVQPQLNLLDQLEASLAGVSGDFSSYISGIRSLLLG